MVRALRVQVRQPGGDVGGEREQPVGPRELQRRRDEDRGERGARELRQQTDVAVRLVGRVCATNLPSNTAFRGFGGPQSNARQYL